MLIYANHMYPSFREEENSLVEDYKKARYTANRRKAVRNSISLLIWTITVTYYFIFSFASWQWMYSWIIFLVGACIQVMALLILNLRNKD